MGGFPHLLFLLVLLYLVGLETAGIREQGYTENTSHMI